MNNDRPVVRCVIYTRALGEYGAAELDPDGQYAACLSYINARAVDNWTVTGPLYHDDADSSSGLRRPALKRLQSQVEKGAIDRLVVYRLNCLTPSFKDLSVFMMFMNYGRCSLVVTGMQIDTSTFHGRQIVDMMMRLTGFEKAVIGQHVVLNRPPTEADVRQVLAVIAQLRATNARRNTAEKEAKPEAE